MTFDGFMARLRPLWGVAALIGLWAFAHAIKAVDPVLLPSPLETLQAFWNGLFQGTLWGDFEKTIVRTVLSFTITSAIDTPERMPTNTCGMDSSSVTSVSTR